MTYFLLTVLMTVKSNILQTIVSGKTYSAWTQIEHVFVWETERNKSKWVYMCNFTWTPVTSTMLNKLTQDTERVCKLSTIHLLSTNTCRHTCFFSRHLTALRKTQRRWGRFIGLSLGFLTNIIGREKSHRCQVNVTHFNDATIQHEKKSCQMSFQFHTMWKALM